MTRAVVIGGNGFLGSHVVDALAGAGFDVTAFDRFGSPLQFTAPGVRQLAGDFGDPEDIAAAVAGQDYVFHFLSTTTPASAESDPTSDISSNISNSVELFSAAASAGVQRVFFASTGGAIYGPNASDLCREDDATNPVSPYAIGKRAVESYLDYFTTRGSFDAVTLRISNPYGSRQKSNRRQGLIPIAIASVLEGHPVTMFGDGGMLRDYVYVDDLAAMVTSIATGAPAHRVYNLGSGVSTSVRGVLTTLRDVSGVDFEVVTAPTPSTFVEKVVLDTSRFTNEFGATELTDLPDGIAKTWRAMKGTMR